VDDTDPDLYKHVVAEVTIIENQSGTGAATSRYPRRWRLSKGLETALVMTDAFGDSKCRMKEGVGQQSAQGD
jgi:hypothetical protein